MGDSPPSREAQQGAHDEYLERLRDAPIRQMGREQLLQPWQLPWQPPTPRTGARKSRSSGASKEYHTRQAAMHLVTGTLILCGHGDTLKEAKKAKDVRKGKARGVTGPLGAAASRHRLYEKKKQDAPQGPRFVSKTLRQNVSVLVVSDYSMRRQRSRRCSSSRVRWSRRA